MIAEACICMAKKTNNRYFHNDLEYMNFDAHRNPQATIICRTALFKSPQYLPPNITNGIIMRIYGYLLTAAVIKNI